MSQQFLKTLEESNHQPGNILTNLFWRLDFIKIIFALIFTFKRSRNCRT